MRAVAKLGHVERFVFSFQNAQKRVGRDLVARQFFEETADFEFQFRHGLTRLALFHDLEIRRWLEPAGVRFGADDVGQLAGGLSAARIAGFVQYGRVERTRPPEFPHLGDGPVITHGSHRPPT